MSTQPPTQDEENIFIEQAEYIRPDELLRWVRTHPREKSILKKISSAGAKLIVGPRGCGKTTLLLKSYFDLNKPQSPILPIYVNYKTSLKIEPLFKTSVNASFWFDRWLILKVYIGLHESLKDRGEQSIAPSISVTNAHFVIAALESGDIADAEKHCKTISVAGLQDEIANILDAISASRAILLLDDAAHAFSFAQQRGFFDFFREVKTRYIAPKAAVYPGVTSFSATFQAGHDAEEIDVWIKPEDKDYLSFMEELVKKRLPDEFYQQLCANEAGFQLLCFAAFGIPRALLNMLHEILETNSTSNKAISTRRVNSAIKQSSANTLDVYRSLKLKIPMYRNFLQVGENIINSSVELIKEYNKNKPVTRQSVTIAIQTPLDTEINRTLGFLEYAALISPKGKISRGEKGTFQLYAVNYAFLVSRNAIAPAKSPSVIKIAMAFSSRNAHEFTRANVSRLLPKNFSTSDFSLTLPPCQNCGSERLNEDAKFCHICGSALKNISIFDQLVNQDIAVLPLTDHRVNTVKQSSNISTVKDILIDLDHKQLRGVPQVGPYWAKRIMSYAEEYIA